jgi:hypothetical protein
LERLVSPAVDLATLAAYFHATPRLAAQLAAKQAYGPLLIALAYLLMCLGIVLGRTLGQAPADGAANGESGGGDQPAPAQDWPGSGCLLGLSLPFSCFVLVMLLETGQLLDEHSPSGAWLARAASSSGWGAGLALLLGAVVLFGAFPAAVLIPRRGAVPTGTAAYWALRLIALCAVNSMVLVTTAFWNSYLAGSERMGLALGGRILVFALCFPLFIVFYAPPRLALLSLEPSRWSLAGYLAFLAVFVWRLTA